MNVLAQDLGTTTGFGLYAFGAIVSGSWTFKPGRFEGGGMRFLRYRRQLDEALSLAGGRIDLVVYEEVRRHRGTDAAHVYGGLQGVLTEWCEAQNPKVPYEAVPVGTIKRYATGKGNADKAAMMAAVSTWGYTLEDDNHADALALLHLKLEEHELPIRPA